MTGLATNINSAQAHGVQFSGIAALRGGLPAPKFEFNGDLGDLSVTKKDSVKYIAMASEPPPCSNCSCSSCYCTGCSCACFGCTGGSCMCIGK